MLFSIAWPVNGRKVALLHVKVLTGLNCGIKLIIERFAQGKPVSE
jgi:hypothetical protein